MGLGIYTRVSSDPNGEQTATGRQEEACRLFAQLRGWTVEEVFEDVDLSAYRDVHRPAYERMLQALEGGAISGVIVWKLDRLVRRPSEFERFWAVAERAGATLASVNDPVDTSTEIGLAIVRILVTFAGLESATTSIRSRARYRQLAEAGQPPKGRRAFGLSRGWTKIVEPEAALIREGARRLLEGESLGMIVDDWNGRGLVTTYGVKWSRNTLRVLLMSPRIVGDRTYHGEVVARDCLPAVLDRLTWERVNEVLSDKVRRGRVRTGARGGPSPLLQGIARCGHCGRHLRGSSTSGCYHCHDRPYGCGRISITADFLEAAVTEAVIERLGHEGLEATATDTRLPVDAFRLATEHQQLVNRLAGDFYVRGLISEAEFRSARRLLVTKLEAERARVLPAWRCDVLRAVAGGTLQEKWQAMSVDRKRALITSVVSAAIVMPSAGRTIADRRKRVRLAWVGEEAPVPLIDEAEERHLASATVSAGPWMSVPEVGERLGLSAWSVRRFIEAGDLGARTGSTPWRVSRGALDQYLRHARIQPGELAAILACTAPPAVEPNAYETIVNLQALLHWSLADIAAYCGIRAETVQHWRRRGVPERHQAALAARIAAAEAEAQEVDEVRPTPI